MTAATFTLTGDIDSDVNRSVYWVLSTDVTNPTDDITYPRAKQSRTTGGHFALTLPADDAVNLPHDAGGPQFYFTVQIGTGNGAFKKWIVPAQAAGSTHDITEFVSAVPASPSTTDATIIDNIVAGRIANPASATYGAGNTAWARIPVAADKVVFVSSRGSDSNDGRSLKTAFLTIQAAITALGGPGLIQLGQGAILTGSSIAIPSGCTIRGVAPPTAGATPGTSITFTGTGTGAFITANSTAGPALQDVMVLYSSSSFTGRLVDLRDGGSGNTAFAALKDVYLGGASGIRTADCLVDISNTHSLRFERVQFRSGAVHGLRGKNISSDTANSITLVECYFNDNTTTHIRNPGDGWTLIGCTFEPLHSGAAGAVICDTNFACNSLTVIGGWAGDVIAAAGGIQYDLTGNNITLMTFIGGNTGSTGVKLRNNSGTAPAGITIASRFDGTATGIDFTGVAPEGYDFTRSSFASNVTTTITGGVTSPSSVDVRTGTPVSNKRNRSSSDSRVVDRYQSDMTSTQTYDFGIDPDGSANKRFGLRDQTGSGTPLRWYVTAAGSVVNAKGTADLASNSTDGFTYIPTTNGTPTGTPTAITGAVPMMYDRSTNKLYIYNGAWKSVTLA